MISLRKLTFRYLAHGGFEAVERDAWGMETSTLVVDEEGVATRRTPLGAYGDHGCYQKRLTADARGFLAEEACYDSKTLLIADDTGCARTTWVRNEQGHALEKRCFDDKRNPTTDTSGAHHTIYTVSENGLDVGEQYLGVDDAPLTVGCAQLRIAYDFDGLPKWRRCASANGDVLWTVSLERDDDGCLLRESNLDAEGELVERDGVAERVWRRGRRCEVKEYKELDASGEIVSVPAITRFSYDEDTGQLVDRWCFDRKRKYVSCFDPTQRQRIGVHVTYEWGRDELLRGEHCFDARGARSACSASTPHETRYYYDRLGRMVGRRFLDTRGSRTDAMGALEVQYERDEAGAIISERYYDARLRRTAATHGCHELRLTLDEKRRPLALTCFGARGGLVASSACWGRVCFGGAAQIVVMRLPDGATYNVRRGTDGEEISRVRCDRASCIK